MIECAMFIVLDIFHKTIMIRVINLEANIHQHQRLSFLKLLTICFILICYIKSANNRSSRRLSSIWLVSVTIYSCVCIIIVTFCFETNVPSIHFGTCSLLLLAIILVLSQTMHFDLMATERLSFYIQVSLILSLSAL